MKKTNLLLAALCAATGIGFTTSCGSTNENVLIVGMECNYSPFNWTAIKEDEYTLPISNAKGQYADGYDVQIAKYIADFIGYNLIIQKLEWEVLIPSLENNTINAVIAGMTDTEDRRKSIDYLFIVIKIISTGFSSNNKTFRDW